MRLLVRLSALLLLTGCTASPLWQSDSTDWRFDGDAWHAAAGEASSFLVSRSRYADVRLSVEFFPDAMVNSGIFVRCQDPQDISALNCFEANIWDNHPRQEFRTGAIVARAFPPLSRVETIGRWNLMEVIALGEQIEVRVNGTLTARLEDAAVEPGFIALQRAESGEIRFRNLEVTGL
jgi:hypothetical protein